MSQYDILIVEDEVGIVDFLSLELKHEGYSVDFTHNGLEALEKVEKHSYRLILLDLMIPGLKGIEVCRRIKTTHQIPILMLTAKADVMDKIMGLEVGAEDYMTKPFAIEELLARIRVIFRREQLKQLDDKKIQLSDLVVDLAKHEVRRQDQVITLTKREYDLLVHLLRNKGQIFTREQLLNQVWGYEFFGELKIVDVYIQHIRAKVDQPYESKLIHTVRGIGYVVKEPD